MRGRGKEEACRKGDREVEKAEIHMDFMFMGEEEGGKTITILVAKERRTRAIMAAVAPGKAGRRFWRVG